MSTHILLPALLLAAAGTFSPAHAGVLRVPKDHSTIMQAVNAARAGDRIVVDPGVYPENIDVTNRSDLRLEGGGRVTVDRLEIWESEKIEVDGFDVAPGIYKAIWVYYSPDVTIRRCRTSQTTFALMATASDRLLVERAEFRDSLAAMRIAFGSGLRVRRCTLENISSEAIVMNETTDSLIERNTMLAAGVLDCWLGENVRIVNNRIAGGGWITSRGSDGTELIGNKVTGSRLGSLTIYTGSAATIRSNKVDQSAFKGIEIHAAAGCHVVGNKVTASAEYGIRVDQGGNTFVRNRVKRSGVLDLTDLVPGENVYRKNRFGSTDLPE